MWNGSGIHNQIQDLMGKEHSEKKQVFVYKDIALVGKVDFLPPGAPDDVWEFKTSEKTMTTSKPWQDHQVKLYCTMFDKKRGSIFQPVTNKDGIYLKHLKTVERDDAWFESEFFRIKFFKKGTVHLVFKDVDLLAVFNRAAAEGKNWVGAGY